MAYGRTFLQLVNDVLRELREEEVASWNENDYSTMVGGWINSCKRDAEAAWRWHDLRDEVAVSAVDGTAVYALSGTNPRSQVLDGWNDTSDLELSQRTGRASRKVRFTEAVTAEGAPTDYTLEKAHATSGELQVRLYPQPDASYTLSFTTYNPTEDFDSNDDLCTIPYKGIVEGATARARFERGEDGGISFEQQALFMRTKLADDIAIDAARHPEELVWEPV